MNIKNTRKLLLFTVFLSFMLSISCSNDADNPLDEESQAEDTEEEDDSGEEGDGENEGGDDSDENSGTATNCENVADFIFVEKDGLVKVEFENAFFTDDWILKADGDSFSGEGYMVWEGSQYLNAPGNSPVTFNIKIENTGTYRFIWKSAVKNGDNGTEHNDSWLRFADAADFYGLQGTDSFVYPKDTGKTPNPEGSSKDGWFKIYRSGNNLNFTWQAKTSDSDAHNIFVVFDSPGTYKMEVSPRSSNHGIDQFVLFNTSVTENNATANETAFGSINCN